MKIFLIRPRWEYPISKNDQTYNRIWFPLSLSYCSAILKDKQYNVKILDFHASRNLVEEAEIKKIKNNDYVFITSSDIDRWQCPYKDLSPVKQICDLVKKYTSNFYMMGMHGTMAPKEMLKMTGAKAILVGEPEFTVLDVVSKGYKQTEGVSYLSGKRIIYTNSRKQIELDCLPMPDYSIFEKGKYFYEIFGDKFILLETTRNCPHSCNFCNKLMYGKRYSLKKIEKVILEIKEAVKYGVKRAYFIDLDIGASRKHLEALCDSLIKLDIDFEWCCQTRLDELDDDLIKRMSMAKCKIIHFGLESGNQVKLDDYNKKLCLKNVKSVITSCKKHKIKTVCFILLDTEKLNMEKTHNYLNMLNPTYVSFHNLVFYSWETVNNNSKINLEKIRKKAYLKYYLRLGYIKNLDLKKIIPNLRIFLNILKK